MRRFTFWAVALAVLVIVLFNVQGWLILDRTGRELGRELGDRLQTVAVMLSHALAAEGADVAEADFSLLTDVMRENGLFNVFVVNENLEYLANARDPTRVGSNDPALELDAAEILSAFSGLPTRSRLYGAGNTYLACAYAPMESADGIVVAVIGAEADARFFSAIRGFQNAMLLINVLSLIAIVATVLVSVSLVRHALRVEQAAARANTLALMGQMSGAVAHEIKNPLGIIRAAAERLERRYDPAPAELDYIRQEVDRLNRIVTNYLSVGGAGVRGRGLGVGGQGADEERVDLAAVIQDVLGSVAHETAGKGIRVEAQLDGLPDAVGSRLELRQVFLNLVLNAIQAQPDGGVIRITGRADGPRLAVEVADQGPGISKAELGQVFEPFFTTREKGSGLGLFVVRRIVEAHGGKVGIRSETGKGTAVEVVLPRGEVRSQNAECRMQNAESRARNEDTGS
jgi:signal transduction histidine kinase